MRIDYHNTSCIYEGAPNTCMCGCAGTYTYTSFNKKYSEEERGYKIDDDEINNLRVTLLLYKFLKSPMPRDKGDKNSKEFFTKIIDGKQYTIYLVKE